MTIELRVLTGARAGHRARFDTGAVTLGRHPQCDLQLDTHQDLDVSSRHAELRVAPGGTVLLQDLGSTNGTWVNGERVAACRLVDGDVVQLGGAGPQIEVRMLASAVRRRPSGVDGMTPPADRRPPIARRIAIGALVVGIAAAYALGARRSADEVAELRRLVAGHDSMTRTLATRLRGVADTSVIAALQRSNDSLRAVVQAGTAVERAGARDEVVRLREGAQALAALDMPAINARNAPAVAYVVSELDGRVVAGTAFAITPDGRLVTNRHLVRAPGGATATRIAVKFRGTRAWRTARVVRVASAETDDLALLQLDGTAPVPVVHGLAETTATLREGAPVVTIGYPLGRATMMEGDGDDFVARTSLYPGTVSKLLPEVLQLAAFAGHGSSGSPVFDASGKVVGVVWGGPEEGQGKIVYAVTADRIRQLLQE